MIKRVEDIHLQFMTSILLIKTYVKVSEKYLRQWVSAFQQNWIISRKLARWRNLINRLLMNSVMSKSLMFWSVFEAVSAELEWSTSWIIRDEKWILYDNFKWWAQWLDHAKTLKHFSKLKLQEQKISMVTVWWSTIDIVGCPRGVMVKAMNCGIVVREFVLQSRYYVHFRANTLGKGMNPLILPPAMGK